jgi:hemerythrin-like domain-containing protein
MDAVALLKADHRTVEDLFRRYESLGVEETEQRTDVVNAFIRELSVHAAIEEQVLYPEVKDVLTGGESMADEALHEHQEAKEMLAELDRMETTDPGFDTKVRALIADVRHHVDEEETEMLPQLASAVPAAKLAELGERMERAKAIAPTRPHPHAPSTPPGNLVAGPIAAAADRARDAISGRDEAKTVKSSKKGTTRRTASTRGTAGRSQKSTKSSSKRRSATTKRSKPLTKTRPSTSKTRKTTSSRSTRSTASKRTSRTTRKGQRRGGEPVFHVRSDDKGGWRAEREGSSRAVARADDKQSVLKRARDLARSRGGRLVVHGRNGRIQEQRSYVG